MWRGMQCSGIQFGVDTIAQIEFFQIVFLDYDTFSLDFFASCERFDPTILRHSQGPQLNFQMFILMTLCFEFGVIMMK